jgi:hypothetical protein
MADPTLAGELHGRVAETLAVVAATLGCWSGAWESPCTIPANVMDRYLVVPRRSSLNVGHAAFRARGEVIFRALCRPGTSSRSPWLHPASRRAVAAHVG